MPISSKLLSPLGAITALLYGSQTIQASPVPDSHSAVYAPGNNTEVYKWPIDEAEARRITGMLGIDFKSFNIAGTLVTTPKFVCEQCHKHSGLDDFIHGALADSIHGKEFIINVLANPGVHRPSEPHNLKCMNCDLHYLEAGMLAKRGEAKTEAEVIADLLERKTKDKRGPNAVPGWATGHSFNWQYCDIDGGAHEDVACP